MRWRLRDAKSYFFWVTCLSMIWLNLVILVTPSLSMYKDQIWPSGIVVVCVSVRACVNPKLVGAIPHHQFLYHITYAWFSGHDPDTIIVQCMLSSACKPVPTTCLFGNIDILYLLSHVNYISLCMGRIDSKWLSSHILNIKASKHIHGWIMIQHWYTPLLLRWFLCKRCTCT